MEHIHSLLEDAIHAHGIRAAFADGSFSLPSGLRLTPLVHEMDSVQGQHAVSLEILAESPLLGRDLVSECFAGFASTQTEAINQAFGKFLLGTFHVLIEALTDHKCSECQAELEHWSGQSGSWTVFSGPLLSQHSSQSVLTPTYSAALETLQYEFEQTQPSGPHWIRVFVAAYHDSLQATEVLLDNELWAQGVEMVTRQDWQPSNEYQSIRHFLLAMPPKG
ncbi:MAG: DUF6348 family protein [Proteobacteria bacterium]|nr:DUF6348 family protein [Pseudomonadota bacterium]